MDTGFYAGLSGLRVHSAALNVIGNNLANTNTVGFKGSRAGFSELFSAAGLGSAGGGSATNGAGVPFQIGLGVQLGTVQQLFSQGSFQPSEIVTDVALQGGGFFMTRAADGLPVYTRAGNFSFNAEGFLVNPSGLKVQGFTGKDADGKIIPSGTPTDIQIPAGMSAPPKATGYFSMEMNLNAGARVDNPATAADESEVFSTGTTIYDSLGFSHNLTIVMTPVDNNADGTLDQWNYEVRIPSKELASPTGTDYDVIDSGAITFDGNGQLTAPSANLNLTIPNFADGAPGQDVEWRLFDANGDSLLTGFAAQSAVDGLKEDGYSAGRIRALAIDNDGVVSGIFTNGQTLELAQLAVASFNNPGGLFKFGDNGFTASLGSGPASVGAANTGGRGSIASKALELSNVDITEQFTNLIVAERGYQANSRVITTADQVLQEAIQIKR